MVVAILLALTTTGAPARAAGVTGLFVDGFNDPLTDGVQTLYEAPDALLSIVGGSSNRSVIVLETDIDGWRLTFGTPSGPELHTGPHQANLVVQREGHACELWGTDVTITELTWGPADVLESFAANFDYGCRPSSGFTGEVRYNASSPIKAVATDSVDVDLGDTEAGDPGDTSYVTVSNIGHVPVALDAPVVEGPDIETHGGSCVAGPLAAGASCTVGVRLTGARIGLGATGRLLVGDETRLGARNVLAGGDVWSDTTTTLRFDPTRQWAGGQMYVNVTVSPAPADGLGGTVTLAYTTNGGDPVSVDLPLASAGTVSTTRDVPRGDHAWTATFHGTDAWRPSTSTSVTKHAGVATTLSVATEVNPVTAGDPVVLHASLVADGYDLPPGTVTFREGSGPVLASDGVGPGDTVANASISSLALGTHDIRASYASSADGSPASDVARVFVVSKGIETAWTATIPMVGDAPLQLGPIASDGGGVYVAGETFGTAVGEVSAGGKDLVVARIDPASGTLVWVTQLGSVADDSLDDLTVTPQGVFVTGSSPGTMVAGGPSGGPYPFVARLTLGGAMTWASEGDRPSDTWRVAPGIDGGVYVAGTASLTAAPDRQGGQVRRYTPGGTRLWEREVASCCWLSKPGYLELRSLTSDEDGLLVGGSAAGSVTGGNDEVNRGWLRRLTPSGSTVWTRELAGPYGSVVTDLLASNEATILAVGNSTAPIAGQPNAAPAQNVWARRYAFNGATTWTKALSRGTVVASCRTFVATNHSEILPSGRRGGSIAELRLDGTDGWRYERTATADTGYQFLDAALGPGRAYVTMLSEAEGAPPAWSVVGLSGIPTATGCDASSPAVSKPKVSFVNGSQLTSTAPVRVTWTATDTGSGVARYELRRRVDGGSWVTIHDGLASPSLTVGLVPGQETAFRGVAVDRGGNRGGTTGPTVSLRRIDDRSTSVRYSSGWRSTTSSTAYRGTLRYATRAGATAAIRFTGRAFAWVAPKGTSRGSARVYVDGAYAGTISLHRSSSDARRVVFSRRWSSSGTHTVTIRVVGTSGHARVDVDALLVLR